MADTKRVIIGSESNDDRKIELDQLGLKVAVPVSLYDSDGAIIDSIAGMAIPNHDYIGLGYDGSNLTSVVYKTGGGNGTTVATLTLVYSGSNLISVTKS